MFVTFPTGSLSEWQYLAEHPLSSSFSTDSYQTQVHSLGKPCSDVSSQLPSPCLNMSEHCHYSWLQMEEIVPGAASSTDPANACCPEKCKSKRFGRQVRNCLGSFCLQLPCYPLLAGKKRATLKCVLSPFVWS